MKDLLLNAVKYQESQYYFDTEIKKAELSLQEVGSSTTSSLFIHTVPMASGVLPIPYAIPTEMRYAVGTAGARSLIIGTVSVEDGEFLLRKFATTKDEFNSKIMLFKSNELASYLMKKKLEDLFSA